jgi:hypothetical protein
VNIILIIFDKENRKRERKEEKERKEKRRTYLRT